MLAPDQDGGSGGEGNSWLIDMRDSEQMVQALHSTSSPRTQSVLNKCCSMDAVEQWFIRYGTKVTPAGRRHGEQLVVCLAVVSTFEAFAILYLLKWNESCM